MRTTQDIDTPILNEVKSLQKREHKSLGRLVSDLLAQALKERTRTIVAEPSPEWIVRPMGARIDVADTASLHDALDRSIEP